ncbi:MAG: hypothetical protein COA59_12270 [Colwellia sp.]|nr:MAG: hypothetical protein COA59_12270 [Colwellia sp.]
MQNPIVLLKAKIFEPIVLADTVGKNKRSANRRKHDNLVKKKSLEVFEKIFPQAFIEPPNLGGFNKKWLEFFFEISKVFGSNKDLIMAHNSIAHAIDKGNKIKLWHVAITTQVVQVKRERPFKTETWFKNFKTISEFEKVWLLNLKHTNKDETKLLTDCIISAVCHSGLNEVYHANALFECLVKSKPLNIKDNLVWLDLILSPEKFQSKNNNFPYSTNTSVEGEALLLSRFFPTTLTLSFIYKYLNKRKNVVTLTPVQLWKTITDELKVLLNTKITRQQFCKAGIGLAETQSGVFMPEALVEYAAKRNMSYSLSSDNWQMLGEHFNYCLIDNISGFKSALLNHQHTTFSSVTKNKSTFELIKDLSDTLKVKEKGKVRSIKKVLNEIRNIFDTQDTAKPLNERIIVGWLISLLEQNKTVSSALRYFSAIGALWISELRDITTEETAESFEALYTGMLEITASTKDHEYKARRFMQIHQFGVLQFNLPSLNEFDFDIERTAAHVRAMFIPESAFKAMIESINQSKNTNREEKLALSCILIFSYRTGMRLGEVLKLQLYDFEWSKEGWLFVRDNKYDNNKSNASRRKVPLLCLLTNDELDIFRAFIKEINMSSNRKVSANGLLFSQSFNQGMPYKNFSVSNLVSQLLKEITKLSLFVFHGLRHSAISRLQLVLHAKELNLSNFLGPLYSELIPYDEERLLKINNMVCGLSKRSKYWALCTFSGHRTPQITFNSYFHFCDLLTFCFLEKNQKEITVEQLHSVSSLSRRLLSNKVKSLKYKRDLYAFEIRALLITKLQTKKFCNTFDFPEKPISQPTKLVLPQEDNSKMVFIVYEVLHALEQGTSIEMLMWLHNLTISNVDEWEARAHILNSINTSRDHSRNISTYRKSGLITALSKNNLDVAEITKLVNFIRLKLDKVSKKDKKEELAAFSKIIKIVLCRTTTSSSGILFRHYSHLIFFLAFMSIFPRNRWYIQIHAKNKQDIAQWKKAGKGCYLNIDTTFTQDKRNVNGQAFVHLLSHSSPKVCKGNQWKKYSSNIIKFTINILAIILIKKEHLIFIKQSIEK